MRVFQVYAVRSLLPGLCISPGWRHLEKVLLETPGLNRELHNPGGRDMIVTAPVKRPPLSCQQGG